MRLGGKAKEEHQASGRFAAVFQLIGVSKHLHPRRGRRTYLITCSAKTDVLVRSDDRNGERNGFAVDQLSSASKSSARAISRKLHLLDASKLCQSSIGALCNEADKDEPTSERRRRFLILKAYFCFDLDPDRLPWLYILADASASQAGASSCWGVLTLPVILAAILSLGNSLALAKILLPNGG